MSSGSMTKKWAAVLGLALLSGCGSQEPAAPSLVAKALPVFLQAQGTPWPARTPATLQVMKCIGLGDMQRAKSLSQAALDAAPQSAEAAFMHGAVLSMTASFGSARLLFERVIEAGPTFAGSERVFYFYAACLVRLGEGELAHESLLAQLELIPGDGDTLAALGDVTLQRGDTAAALEYYREALIRLRIVQKEGAPNEVTRAIAHAGIANALLQQGQLEDALQSMLSSIALDPSVAQSWYLLSRIHQRLGDHDKARQATTRFQRLNPQK